MKKYKSESFKRWINNYKAQHENIEINSIHFNDIQSVNNYLNPTLTRRGMFDINYDILSKYMQQESEYINKHIGDNTLFFHQLMKKVKPNGTKGSLIIEASFYEAMSVGYIHYYPKVNEHWNFLNKLSLEAKNNIIKKEIVFGVDGYNFLKQFFTKTDFHQFSLDIHDKQNRQYNLSEFIMSECLFSSFKASPKLALLNFSLQKELSQDIHYQSLVEKWGDKRNTIYPHKLDLLNNAALNEVFYSEKINQHTVSDTLYNFSKYYYMSSQIAHFLPNSKKQTAYGLNGKQYNTIISLLNEYAEDEFLKPLIKPVLLDKIENATKSLNQSFWKYILLEYSLYKNTHKKPSLNKI